MKNKLFILIYNNNNNNNKKLYNYKKNKMAKIYIKVNQILVNLYYNY